MTEYSTTKSEAVVEYNNLRHAMWDGRIPDRAVLRFWSKQANTYIDWIAQFGGTVILMDVNSGIRINQENYDLTMPNPNIPPDIAFSFQNVRYFNQLEWLHMDLQARNWWPYDNELFKSGVGGWNQISHRIDLFDSFYNSCHKTWINNPGKASPLFIKQIQKRLFEEKQSELQEKRWAKWDAHDAMWKEHLRAVKLRKVRRMKLEINPMQIMGSAKMMENYASSN